MTKDEIADAFKDYPLVMDALAKETVQTQDEALTDLYRKIRPADTPTPEAGKNLLDSFYFNTKRYDLIEPSVRSPRRSMPAKPSWAPSPATRSTVASSFGQGGAERTSTT